MTIVSNASPLINLARIGNWISFILYDSVLIPQAGMKSWCKGRSAWGREVSSVPGYPERSPIHNWYGRYSKIWCGRKAIVLALETKAELLLMDERLGRETARHMGSLHTVLERLIEAKHKGH